MHPLFWAVGLVCSLAAAREPESFRWTLESGGKVRSLGSAPFQLQLSKGDSCFVSQALPARDEGAVFRVLTCGTNRVFTHRTVHCRTGGLVATDQLPPGNVTLRCDPGAAPMPDLSTEPPKPGLRVAAAVFRLRESRFSTTGLRPSDVLMKIDGLLLYGSGEIAPDADVLDELNRQLAPERAYETIVQRNGKEVPHLLPATIGAAKPR